MKKSILSMMSVEMVVLAVTGCSLNNVSAYAMPKVGDSATYSIVSINENGKRLRGIRTREIVEVNSDDPNELRYNVKTTTKVRGNPVPEVDIGWIDSDMVGSEEDSLKIVKNCKALGLKPKTYRNGKLKLSACAQIYPNGGGDIWIAAVPFAIVHNSDGKFTMKLVSFHRANDSKTLICNDEFMKVGLKTDERTFYQTDAKTADAQVTSVLNASSEATVSFDAKSGKFNVDNRDGCVPVTFETIRDAQGRILLVGTNHDDQSKSEMICHWLPLQTQKD